MDPPDVIRKKVMSAVTDSKTQIEFDETRPAITNLVTILSLVTKQSFDEIKTAYLDKGYGDFKKDLAEALVLYLMPLQAEINGWLNNKDELITILKNGAERAQVIAAKKMKVVKEKIGVSI